LFLKRTLVSLIRPCLYSTSHNRQVCVPFSKRSRCRVVLASANAVRLEAKSSIWYVREKSRIFRIGRWWPSASLSGQRRNVPLLGLRFMARLLWLALWRGRNQLPQSPAKPRPLTSRPITLVEYGEETPNLLQLAAASWHLLDGMTGKNKCNWSA
jgi:hypothetical protein